MAQADVSNDTPKVGSLRTDVPWYAATIPESKISGPAREVLEKYSKIPSKDVEAHVYAIRSKAWQIFPYPCIGGFRFLDLAIANSPYYPTLLERLSKEGTTFLDLGCCFGQEIRRLVHDGALGSNLIGVDLRPEFFSLGYELFRDTPDSLGAKFIAADIFEAGGELGALEGKVDVVYVGSFLHLFGWDEQVRVCERLGRMLRGAGMVIGRQVGNRVAGEKKDSETNERGGMWRHNRESFERMWKVVGERTGTRWRVECEMVDVDKEAGNWRDDEDMVRLHFTVTKEE